MAQPDEIEPAQSSRTDPFFDIPSDIEKDPPEATSAPTRPAQNDHNLQMVHGSLLMISLLLNGETDYLKWLLG